MDLSWHSWDSRFGVLEMITVEHNKRKGTNISFARKIWAGTSTCWVARIFLLILGRFFNSIFSALGLVLVIFMIVPHLLLISVGLVITVKQLSGEDRITYNWWDWASVLFIEILSISFSAAVYLPLIGGFG